MDDKPGPQFGHTRRGLPVHGRVIDHLRPPPGAHPVVKANAWLAVKITQGVGTMWCAYAFALFDLLALPTAIRGGLYGIVQWAASFFLQLVLLSIIMVGQAGQAAASDARSAKQFEDTEVIVDRLDTRTQGGLQEVMARLETIEAKLEASPAGE